MSTDWKAKEKDKYSRYLASREWAVKREAVRKRASGKCERCEVLPMDACHHITYERKYNEDLEDLEAICDFCHEFNHGKSDFNPCENIAWLNYMIATRDDDDRPAVDPTAAFFGHTYIMEQSELFEIVRHLNLTSVISNAKEDQRVVEACTNAIAAMDRFFSRTAILWLQHGMPRITNATYPHMLDVIGISDRDDPKNWER